MLSRCCCFLSKFVRTGIFSRLHWACVEEWFSSCCARESHVRRLSRSFVWMWSILHSCKLSSLFSHYTFFIQVVFFSRFGLMQRQMIMMHPYVQPLFFLSCVFFLSLCCAGSHSQSRKDILAFLLYPRLNIDVAYDVGCIWITEVVLHTGTFNLNSVNIQ